MKKTETQKKIINTMVNDCLFVRLRLINRIIGGIYDKALKPHGIKSTQLAILATVSTFETTTSKQLCQLLYMDTSTFSRTLGILKKNHWLHTEPSGEGKILNIGITAEGLKKLETAYPDWQKAQEEAIKDLGEATAEKVVSTGTRYLFNGITT
jgi:DNA-binding MarR family transcriptional regulator